MISAATLDQAADANIPEPVEKKNQELPCVSQTPNNGEASTAVGIIINQEAQQAQQQQPAGMTKLIYTPRIPQKYIHFLFLLFYRSRYISVLVPNLTFFINEHIFSTN